MSGRETPSGVGGDPPRQPMKRPAHSSHGDPGPSKRVSYNIKDSESPTARLSDTEPVNVSAGADAASNPSQPGRPSGAEAALEYRGAAPTGMQLSISLASFHSGASTFCHGSFASMSLLVMLVPLRLPERKFVLLGAKGRDPRGSTSSALISAHQTRREYTRCLLWWT